MKMTGTVIKLGIFTLVLLLFTAIIIVVFGQMRFDRTTGYSAVFSSASGLRSGQFVRASGVEVGKVSNVELINGGSQVKIDFDVDRSLPLFDGTTASIRYLNLIGDRYMELKRGDSDKRLPGGGTIPVEHTEPALDLDALIGGFRPVFRALDPDREATFEAHAAAWDFFSQQPPSYRQTAIYWVMNAKREETRTKRLARLIEESAARRRL